MSLRLDWCSHEAAKYAVEHWHYSGVMPSGALAKIGVWEDGLYTGVVLFGHGAISHIGDPFGLTQWQCVELVRVALREHRAQVSRIVAIALRMVKAVMSGLRLVVSFADPMHGHHGGIYQAGGWFYLGAITAPWKVVNGTIMHPRSIYSRYHTHSLEWLKQHVDPSASILRLPSKHKYVMPLDEAMRAQIAPLAKPYPKRAGSIGSDAVGVQPTEGGAVPTSALQQAAV